MYRLLLSVEEELDCPPVTTEGTDVTKWQTDVISANIKINLNIL